MTETLPLRTGPIDHPRRWTALAEVAVVVLLFFAVGGGPPPGINEAHYLALAKNFWQPDWCVRDPFIASSKTHLLFHATFGALTQIASLPTAAWIGRLLGWTMLAFALRGLTRAVCDLPYACVAVATIWTAGVQTFNLSGEWVIGGIEGKVPAYAFVLLALRELSSGNWPRTWPWLGIASAFHVLVGGWTVVAAMLAYLVVGRSSSLPRAQILPLFLGGAIATIGLWPALLTSQANHPSDASLAAHVYTYWRLPHHLLPSAFSGQAYWLHLSLVSLTLTAAWPLRLEPRFRGLFWTWIGCLAIAGCGLAIGLLPKVAPTIAAKLLRYYWFRPTDALTPLMLGLAIVTHCRLRTGGMLKPNTSNRDMLRRWVGWAQAVPFSVAILAIPIFQQAPLSLPESVDLGPGRQESAEVRRLAYQDWQDACEWIRKTMPSDEILITPRHQQTFKWYADRAEVVNWKDIPQDAASMVSWHHRFTEIFPQRLGTVRATIRYPDLIRFRSLYGVRFMVVDRRVVGSSLPLMQVYPSARPTSKSPIENRYAVYRLP